MCLFFLCGRGLVLLGFAERASKPSFIPLFARSVPNVLVSRPPILLCVERAASVAGRLTTVPSSACQPHRSLPASSSPCRPRMTTRAQELRRRFAASGSSATAFSVNPGAVRSDIWRHVPKLVMPVFDFFMRLLFLNTEQVKNVHVVWLVHERNVL